MYITEDENESDDQENTDTTNEKGDVLMNDEDILTAIEENEEEDDSLNNDIESRGSEERKSSDSEERVSSHGRPVRENAGSGVERLEMGIDGKSYSHNTHRQFMIIREKYNADEDVDKYHSLFHKVMFTQTNAKKGIRIFGERAIIAMFKEYKQLDDGPVTGKPVILPLILVD